MKSVVITGASSGIGFAACEKFLVQGYIVFGSVRKSSDASRLKKLFGERFIPLLFDINDKDSIMNEVKIVKKKLGENILTALVNNAGIAILGPLEFLDINDFKRQLETNVVGTLNCIQAFLPLLGSKNKKITQRRGRIINISSALGGKIGYPFYGAYCSSKHGLEGLSESLRRELAVHDIFVSIVAPGAIETPIWDKAEHAAFDQKYDQTPYKNPFKKMIADMKKIGSKGLKPEIVAKKILQAVETKKPKIRYTFISEFTLNLLYFAPRALIDRLVTRYLGLKNNN